MVVRSPGEVAAAGGRSSRPRGAVIGVGTFGEQHVTAHSAVGAEIVAVVDRDAERARAVAQRHGVPCWYTDPERMLAECEPAGVTIATDAAQHPELAGLVLDHGAHVLVEKPIALSPADLDPLLSHPARDRLRPGHILRFAAAYRELRQLLQSGDLGRLLAISASRDRPAWHSRRYRGTHIALLTAIHDIDLALWLTGAAPRSASALATGPNAPEQPDLISGLVRAEGGTVWQIQASWLLPDDASGQDRLVAYTEAGSVTVIADAAGARLTLPSGRTITPSGPDPLQTELAEFWQGVATATPATVVTLDAARTGIAVANALIESSRSAGARVEI